MLKHSAESDANAIRGYIKKRLSVGIGRAACVSTALVFVFVTLASMSVGMPFRIIAVVALTVSLLTYGFVRFVGYAHSWRWSFLVKKYDRSEIVLENGRGVVRHFAIDDEEPWVFFSYSGGLWSWLAGQQSWSVRFVRVRTGTASLLIDPESIETEIWHEIRSKHAFGRMPLYDTDEHF